jgi:hypothetical protein
MKVWNSITMVVLAASACAQTAKPKLAELYTDDVRNPIYLKVDGVWEPDHSTKQNELVFAVVSIQCYRHGGKDSVGSDPFCVVATAMPIAGTLSVDANFLKVIEWNAKEIITLDDSADCVTSQNTFDLTSKTVVGMDIRKPNAKGFLDSCKLLPDRQTYYLREKVDYSLYHVPVKK